MNKGFTLIEIIVVIAIISILSGIILFSVTQYINKGKDSNIAGNLAVLVPAGEAYYNARPNSYEGFCESSVVNNAKTQMPDNPSGSCSDNPKGVCCHVEDPYFQAWAACAPEFTDSSSAYCVDSRGMKKHIGLSSCTANITKCD